MYIPVLCEFCKLQKWRFCISVKIRRFFHEKNVDHPEKTLKYKHIRRISD